MIPQTHSRPDATQRPEATQPPAAPHSRSDDVLALLSGSFVASLGLYLLKTGDAVTGGTAGLALLVSYAVPLPFGVIFLAVNAPFFVLSMLKKGWNFTIRTVIAVALVSAFSTIHPLAAPDFHPNPAYAAVAGNLLAGMGLLILFRHQASLGGFNILALILQERYALRAGYVQLALDAIVVLSALAVVTPINVLRSALGAVVLGLVLALNHRPGRYLGA